MSLFEQLADLQAAYQKQERDLFWAKHKIRELEGELSVVYAMLDLPDEDEDTFKLL
jgi:hypothetical protein